MLIIMLTATCSVKKCHRKLLEYANGGSSMISFLTVGQNRNQPIFLMFTPFLIIIIFFSSDLSPIQIILLLGNSHETKLQAFLSNYIH